MDSELLPTCLLLRWVVHGQEGFEEEVTVPLARMEYGSAGQCYVLLRREAGSMTLGKLGACMQFTVKEIDPSTGEESFQSHTLPLALSLTPRATTAAPAAPVFCCRAQKRSAPGR